MYSPEFGFKLVSVPVGQIRFKVLGYHARQKRIEEIVCIAVLVYRHIRALADEGIPQSQKHPTPDWT
jgi:hypothetical protein